MELWGKLGLLLLPIAAKGVLIGHACSFVAYLMVCEWDYDGVDLRLTALAHPCADPLDVTFVVQSASPSFLWTHTFAVTNREESVVVPQLSLLNTTINGGEVVRLSVQFAGDLEPSRKNRTGDGDLPTILVRAALEAQSGRVEFVDSLFVVRDEPGCGSASVRAEDSATQVAAVAALSILLVSLVSALLVYIYYQRRQKNEQLAAALGSQVASKSAPYQEQGQNGSRIVANGVMETSLIIENPTVPPSEVNAAPEVASGENNGGAFHIVNPVAVKNTGAIPKSSRRHQAQDPDKSKNGERSKQNPKGASSSRSVAEDKVPVVTAEEKQS